MSENNSSFNNNNNNNDSDNSNNNNDTLNNNNLDNNNISLNNNSNINNNNSNINNINNNNNGANIIDDKNKQQQQDNSTPTIVYNLSNNNFNNTSSIGYNYSYGSLIDAGGHDNIIYIDKSRGQNSSNTTSGLNHARSYSQSYSHSQSNQQNNNNSNSKNATARNSCDLSNKNKDDDISVSFHDTYSDNQRIHQHPETGLPSIEAKEKLKKLVENLLDEKELINPFETIKIFKKELIKVTPILYLLSVVLLVLAYGLRHEYGFQAVYIILSAGLLLIFIVLHFFMVIREQKLEHNETIAKARGHLKRYEVFGDTLENGITTISDSISLMSVCRDEVWKKLPLSILVEGDLASLREGETVQVPLKCIEQDFKEIHLEKGEVYSSDLLQQKLIQISPNKDKEEIAQMAQKLYNSGRSCFLLTETPCFNQISMSIDEPSKLRPVNPVINAINYIYVVIERFLWASVGVSMLANIFRSIFQDRADLVDLLIIRQVNLIIAFSFVMLPCILLLITYSIGHAKLLALYDVLQERSLKGEISDDHPALNFDTEYNDDKIPAIPFKLMKTYWGAILSTKHVAFSHSSKLLHSIASTTVICCIDKEGVVSEPVNTVGEVCFLKDEPVRLELSSEYSHTQYSISFNDNYWRDHINSLKPLGLDCLLNRTCRLYSEVKIPPPNSEGTTSLPHSNSQVFSQDQASKLQLIRDRESSSESNSQCLCLLAKEIGFSEDVLNQYIRLKEIHTLTQSHKNQSASSSSSSLHEDSSPFMISLVSKERNSDTLQLLTKGSTELVLEHCQLYYDGTSIKSFTDSEKEKIKQIFNKWGSNESLNTICFAYKPIENYFKKLFISGNVNSPLVDVRFDNNENNENNNINNNNGGNSNRNVSGNSNVRKNSKSIGDNNSLRVQLTSKNIDQSKLNISEGMPTIFVASPLPGSSGQNSSTPKQKKKKRLQKFSLLSTSNRFLKPKDKNNNNESKLLSPPISSQKADQQEDDEENQQTEEQVDEIDQELEQVKRIQIIDSEDEDSDNDDDNNNNNNNNNQENSENEKSTSISDEDDIVIKKIDYDELASDRSVDIEEYENENDESDYSSDSETGETIKEDENINKKSKNQKKSTFSPKIKFKRSSKKEKKKEEVEIEKKSDKKEKKKDKKSNNINNNSSGSNNNNSNQNRNSNNLNNDTNILSKSLNNFENSRNNSFDTGLLNSGGIVEEFKIKNHGSSLSDSFAGDELLLPTNLEDIDVLEKLQMNQIFIGMVGMRVLPKSHANHFVEVLRSAGIRFVYFSSEDRRTSNSFVNRLGLETDWNCCISLRDPGPNEINNSSLPTTDGPSRLPKGISMIRQHLEEVDNVPLLVPMFSDCTKENTKEMIKILQENGEVVCCIGSSLNYDNTSIFCQSDLAFGLEPAVPRCLNQPLNRGDPLPLLTSRNFFETPTDNSLSGTSKDPSLPLHAIAGTKRVPSDYPSTHSLCCDITSLPCSLVFHRRTDFNEILKFFHVGRQLLTNTRQCLLFILSASMALVLMTLVAGILAVSLSNDGVVGQVPLTGLQLMWLEFIIIPILGFSLLATPEDKDVMTTISPKNNSEFKHIPTFAQYIAIRLIPSILLTAFFFLWSLHSLTGVSWANIFGANLNEWSSNGTSYSSALLVSQNIMMFAFVYYLCITSISFIHHTQSILKFNPLKNYIWIAMAILCISLQIAFSFISLKVIDGIHLLGDVSWELYIVLFCWAFFVILIDEFVKRKYKNWFDDLQLESRLEFDTKLGMHSPI